MTERLPREWIGMSVRYRGVFYAVIEVLDADSDQPQLVLKGEESRIQPDQWGDARRRVPDTLTVRLYTEVQAINPELEWDQDA